MSDTNPKPALASIPPELQNKIFSYLDPVTSTCLGLTSKKFYAIHKSLHGVKVTLLLTDTDFFGTGTRDWLKDKIAPEKLRRNIKAVRTWEIVEQMQLKYWVKNFRDYTRQALCNRFFPETGHEIALEARRMVLECSVEELDAFIK
ncbi:hypothetical protein F5882DRAFT_381409 [Hyaloscypha sp. PMI_1271]|nr:hypothetical protein F5882DRAFT_381409 [Hyaloscypha sp. PMI_1271]